MHSSEQGPVVDSPSNQADVPLVKPVSKRRLWLWLGGLLGMLSLLAILSWCYVLYQIVPKIEQWREPLVQEATRQLGGSRLTIGQIQGSVVGGRPVVRMTDVRIIDARGREGLSLPRLTAKLSLRTLLPNNLWQRQPVFSEILLEQPTMVVRHEPNGDWQIAGVSLSSKTSDASDSTALAWLLSQRFVRIQGGTLVSHDALLPTSTATTTTSQDSTALQAVDLTLRSRNEWRGRVHTWALQATPPTRVGERVTLEAHMRQPWWQTAQPAMALWKGFTRPGQWRQWTGHVQVDLPHVDVQSLRDWISLPAQIQGGRGHLALNAQILAGRLQAIGVDSHIDNVSIQLDDKAQALAFKRFAGLLTIERVDDNTRMSIDKLSFTTDEGLVWPESHIRLDIGHSASNLSASGAPADRSGWQPWLQWAQDWQRPDLDAALHISRVDLALLNRLADRLPISGDMREQWRALAPQGIGDNLSLSWRGAVATPRSYRLQGQLSQLSWMPGESRPGLSGATLTVDANQDGGQAAIKMSKGWVEFPGAFDEPRVPIDTLQAKMTWRKVLPASAALPAGLAITIENAVFSNADATGALHATWQTGPTAADRFPGTLDMQGRLEQAQGTRVWRYLPALMRAEARNYVREAVRSGTAHDVKFLVRGPLKAFPFKDNVGGKFQIIANAKDVELAYVPYGVTQRTVTSEPYWPAFQQLSGQLIFEGQGMRIANASAVLSGVGTGTFKLNQVDGAIPDLDNPDPLLTIAGQGAGPLDDLLQFIHASPVEQWTGHMLEEAKAQGQASLNLSLVLPLLRIADATVAGQVDLSAQDQAAIALGDGIPALQAASGRIEFTEASLSVNASASAWGQAIRIKSTTDAGGMTRFVANGQFGSAAFRQAKEWPVLKNLANFTQGQTPVTVTVTLPKRGPSEQYRVRPEVQIASDLNGLGLMLPAPLNKPMASRWPLQITQRDDAATGSDQLAFNLKSADLTLQGNWHRRISGKQRVLDRGVLQIAQGKTTLPAITSKAGSGVAAYVSLPALNLQEWAAVWEQWQRVSSTGTGRSDTETSDFGTWLPKQITLRSDLLAWQAYSLNDVNLRLQRAEQDTWQASVTARELAGNIEWSKDTSTSTASAGDTYRLQAKLDRLSVPKTNNPAIDAAATSQLLTDGASKVPALDIVVNAFEWRGLPLGRLEIQAINRVVANPGQAPMPEWRLTRLTLSNPDAQLQASGNWALLGPQQAGVKTSTEAHASRSAFTFNLALSSTGDLLTRFGLPKTIRNGKGQMSGQLAWSGSPLRPDVATMSGDMKIAIEEGQFLKVDPGAARLLGVLSLQALPRRLLFDFRDLFQQGFAFDRIDGDVALEAGMARTGNLRMSGVQAVVLMEGKANLRTETQDLRVFVVPEINAGTASLAYAVINPAIGLGTFIAQMLLRKTVEKANTREFRITGAWADPQVEPVNASQSKSSGTSAEKSDASAPAPATAPSPSP